MQDGYDILATLEQNILKATIGKPCEEETEKVVSFYKDDFDRKI